MKNWNYHIIACERIDEEQVVYGLATHLKFPTIQWIYSVDKHKTTIHSGLASQTFYDGLQTFLQKKKDDLRNDMYGYSAYAVQHASEILAEHDIMKEMYTIGKTKKKN